MVIRKLPGQRKFRIYSKMTGKNLGTFKTRPAAEKHLRDIEFFKRRGKK